MKVSYYSLGCKVNLYETTAIINQFIDHGFEVVSFNDVSDVYIINTCISYFNYYLNNFF